MKEKKSVLFSGIQPSGHLHIGNYLGAIQNWVRLQNEGKYQCIFSIVDYHALTGDRTAAERRAQIFTVAAELLALGIDPKKSIFFVQSHVPEHTELAWIFSTLTPMAELERMTQYKDKSAHQAQNINTGLFTYPVLQSADILLYHTAVVPVGQDQVQHIELARDTARWFNNKFGAYFPEPRHALTPVPKVMSLSSPEKKMSKSHGADSVIELADSPEEIARKIKKAVTASEPGTRSPGVENLLLLLREFGEASVYESYRAAQKNGSIQYGALKTALAESLAAYFAAFREKRAYYIAHPRKVEAALALGAKQASVRAKKTMKEVRKAIGVR
jgi:tryptophanyl-tRNA synthetase